MHASLVASAPIFEHASATPVRFEREKAKVGSRATLLVHKDNC